MKTLIHLLVVILSFSACQETKNKNVTSLVSTNSINQKQLEKEVSQVTDLYFRFYKELNANALNKLLTDDCITMGSDPSEVWNKTTMIQKIKNLKANPNSENFTKNLKFDLINRVIQISKNGTSATVTDHSEVSFSKMLIRKTTKLKKIGDDWKINYINTSLVASNDISPKPKKVNSKNITS